MLVSQIVWADLQNNQIRPECFNWGQILSPLKLPFLLLAFRQFHLEQWYSYSSHLSFYQLPLSFGWSASPSLVRSTAYSHHCHYSWAQPQEKDILFVACFIHALDHFFRIFRTQHLVHSVQKWAPHLSPTFCGSFCLQSIQLNKNKNLCKNTY